MNNTCFNATWHNKAFRLIQLGNWLKINGEAIYGSKPFSIKEEEKVETISRLDNQINFNWVRNSPIKGVKEDDFTVEWNGYIEVPKGVTCTMYFCLFVKV
mgnify:CR=1 FL=1